MKELKIIICDDSSQEAENYETLCRQLCRGRGVPAVLKRYQDPNQFLADMSKAAFAALVNIVLIEPTGSFERVPAAIRGQGYDGLIVYLSHSTAIEQAMKGYDNRAYNYTLKGSDDAILNRFISVFHKALDESQKLERQYISLECGGTRKLIRLQDIYYFESAVSHMAIVHYKEGSFKFVSTLSALEERLAGWGFVRAHRSFLVSTSAIDCITKKTLTMKNGQALPVSRNASALNAAMNSRSL